MDLLCREDAALVTSAYRSQQIVGIVTAIGHILEAGTDASVLAGGVSVAPHPLHHLLVIAAELVVVDHRAVNWAD